MAGESVRAEWRAPEAVVRHPNPMPALEDVRRRYLQSLAAATGYMTLLLVEQPRYRRAVLKYVGEGLRGGRRAPAGGRTASAIRLPLARAVGATLRTPALRPQPVCPSPLGAGAGAG